MNAALAAADLTSQSSIGQLITVYIAGFLTSLTPCVYPLIPLTLAIFGCGDVSRGRAFLLSLCYVGGICVTFTTLGMLSATTGVVFGSALGNPMVVGIVCAFLFLLTLFTLDMLQFPFIQKLQTKANTIGGRGFGGSFLMGSVSGFVAAPCVGPILIVILGIAAASKQPAWGAALLFTYSIGVGTLIILLGTFSGLINRLPKSGNWLRYVKYFIAVALLTVIVLLLDGIVPNAGFHFGGMLRPYIIAAVGVVALLLLHFGHKREVSLGLLCSAGLSALFVFNVLVPRTEAIPVALTATEKAAWSTDFDQALKQASTENKIVMVDLFAEWCAACKELDAITFPNAAVQKELSKMVLARVDFTTGGELSEKLTDQYKVLGLPCLLFLRPDGSEIPESRINGFVPPEEFVSHLGARVLK